MKGEHNLCRQQDLSQQNKLNPPDLTFLPNNREYPDNIGVKRSALITVPPADTFNYWGQERIEDTQTDYLPLQTKIHSIRIPLPTKILFPR